MIGYHNCGLMGLSKHVVTIHTINNKIIKSFFQFDTEICSCGQSSSKSNTRIFRGKPKPSDQYPWFIFIKMICIQSQSKEIRKTNQGGTLITSKHVLTAAHLFYESDKHKCLTDKYVK